MNAQTATLNLIPGGVPVIVKASQYDVGREFEFSFLDGQTSYTIPVGASVEITGGKPDYHGFAYDETTGVIEVSQDRATITVKTTQQMTAVGGMVTAEINIIQGDNKIGTANFTILVEKGGLNDETIVSDTDIPVIIAGIEADIHEAEEAADRAEAAAEGVEDWAKLSESYAKGGTGTRTDEDTDNADYYRGQAAQSATDANTAKGQAQTAVTNATNKALDAEAYANGTRNGQAVPDTDPAYHNNAKYHADECADEVEDAEAWAKGTRNGVPVPSTDPAYQNNSKFFSDNAAAVVGIGIATTSTAGIVKPDGDSIEITQDGTLSAHSGHTIYDSTDTAVAQKKKMKFMRATVENIGDETVVTPNGGVTAHALSSPKAARPIARVASFNGRHDNVIPQAGDYDAEMVGAIPAIEGQPGQLVGFGEEGFEAVDTPVYTGEEGQILGFVDDNVVGAMDPPPTGVTSFNGREDDVIPQIGDYTAQMVGAIPVMEGTAGQVIGFNSNNEIAVINQEAPDMSNYLKTDGTRAAAKLTIGTRGTGAEGTNSFTAGTGNKASGIQSQAEGQNTEASGDAAHAEGMSTLASGDYSHASGFSTTASGNNSFAANDSTTAGGNSSFATGKETSAGGDYSFTAGRYTRAPKNHQFAVGYGNIGKNDTLFEVGNATGNTPGTLQRKNAMEISETGDMNVAGTYKKDGYDLIQYSTTDIGVGAYLKTGTTYMVYQV